MIDWHSHILPGIDDGSRHVAESISMMQLQKSQGVDTVIATPHFYANQRSVSAFLEGRQMALEQLKQQLPAEMPEIRLGAEVLYYPGISRLENLQSLRIEDSKVLLLEMPMTRWDESTVNELIELSGKSRYRLLLAHVERCMPFQKREVWDRLRENDVLMQSNASFFASYPTRRKAISLLKNGYIQFIGSDCHNMTSRAPAIGKAFDRVRLKLGEEFLNQMDAYGHRVLK